ncbi:hypothetical protein ACQCSV_01550 [Pseudarthrobacter sp. S3]|uniref:hypothetical protein n=1 Tax=Pseudarthrobacter sp. S3 TaxID=3418419 RepID=UPI003CF34338
MPDHERNHLAADLQGRDLAVEIDPVQALNIQGHVAVENLIDINHHNYGSPDSSVGVFSAP